MIALVAATCRLPGANSLREFWRLVSAGVDAITTLSDDDLITGGEAADVLSRGNYVRRRGLVQEPFQFDHRAFGMSPKEAAVTDPQHRILLELAEEALEKAGYSQDVPLDCGVFVGAGLPTHWFQLRESPATRGIVDPFIATLGNDRDYLSTRLSYRLNLTGPSVAVQTACSTSLVAVHLAMQSLLSGECSFALAGGVSIRFPQELGYLAEEGSVLSPDGVCRPFDVAANGTVPGNGAGMVLLRRLDDAIEAGDPILAVIRGSAMNNDGNEKAGFTAPSVRRQADVIAEAMQFADAAADSIGYVETHGTGTVLGDPIEFSALRLAYESTGATGQARCALGSVKPNIGHLDTAAGVVGLIKAALVVRNGVIPPMTNFGSPNPHLDLAGSPFYIPTETREWQDSPRRAGVSSLGVGGTNVHVVLEQAPSQPPRDNSLHRAYPLLVSAATPEATRRMFAEAAATIEHSDDSGRADMAFTTAVGRRTRRFRQVGVVQPSSPSIEFVSQVQEASNGVAPLLLVPGSGAFAVGCLAELALRFPAVRETVQRLQHACDLSFDLERLLLRRDGDLASARRPSIAFPALLAAELALLDLLAHFGISADNAVGHSLGEYAIAVSKGVFRDADAIMINQRRGQLIEELGEAGMTAVNVDEQTASDLTQGLASVAVVNAPSRVVVGGPIADLMRFEEAAAANGIATIRLGLGGAPHSRMCQSAASAFGEYLDGFDLSEPSGSIVSGRTGAVVAASEAASTQYWVDHLTTTCRFDLALGAAKPSSVALDIGPGTTLASLVRQNHLGPNVISLGDRSGVSVSEESVVSCLTRAWANGVDIEWSNFFGGSTRRRVVGPTYAYERELHRMVEDEARPQLSTGPVELEPRDRWLYSPVFRSTAFGPAQRSARGSAVLVAKASELEWASDLLRRSGYTDIEVLPVPTSDDGSATLEFKSTWMSVLSRASHTSKPTLVLSTLLCGESPTKEFPTVAGLTGVVALVQAADSLGIEDLDVVLLTTGLVVVEAADTLDPAKSVALGPARVVRQEYGTLAVRVIDIDTDSVPGSTSLVSEISGRSTEDVVAIRGSTRWVPDYEGIDLGRLARPAELPVETGATYVVTGGTGGLGLAFANHIAMRAPCNLILIARRILSDSDPRWDTIRSIEESGSSVEIVSADVGDLDHMMRLRSFLDHGPRLAGIIHTAGIEEDGPIFRKDAASVREVLRPKVAGTIALADAFGNEDLDFFVLCSSINSVLGGFGKVDITAANAFLDAFSSRCRKERPEMPVVSIAWDTWRDVGLASKRHGQISDSKWNALMNRAMSTKDALATLDAAIATGLANVVVHTRSLNSSLQENRRFSSHAAEGATLYEAVSPRSVDNLDLSSDEKLVAAAWKDLLGVGDLSPDDDFFDLGGDSLVAVQLRTMLAESTQRNIPLRALLENPTLRSMAAAVASAAGSEFGSHDK